MEIKNLINHCTFIHSKIPHKYKLIIPVQLVPKAKQTANGKLDKLKLAKLLVATLINVASRKQKLHTDNISFHNPNIAEASPSGIPNIHPVDIPQPFADTWSPCAFSRGVKLLIPTTCATRRTLTSTDYIGAYLQAKVIGCHFMKLFGLRLTLPRKC